MANQMLQNSRKKLRLTCNLEEVRPPGWTGVFGVPKRSNREARKEQSELASLFKRTDKPIPPKTHEVRPEVAPQLASHLARAEQSIRAIQRARREKICKGCGIQFTAKHPGASGYHNLRCWNSHRPCVNVELRERRRALKANRKPPVKGAVISEASNPFMLMVKR